MSSEYYRKKFQDIKPDKPIELTRKEKFQNWWVYHWHHVLIAIGASVLVIVLLMEFVFKTRPDYKVAYVGEFYMNVDTQVLQQSLAELGQDLNGDGKVVVQLRSYSVSESNPYYEADMVGLTGDIGVGGSAIFILEDSDWFRERYGIITEEQCYAWSDCPALSHIDLGGEYDIALRIYENIDNDNPDAVTLWEAMTAGAE